MTETMHVTEVLQVLNDRNNTFDVFSCLQLFRQVQYYEYDISHIFSWNGSFCISLSWNKLQKKEEKKKRKSIDTVLLGQCQTTI